MRAYRALGLWAMGVALFVTRAAGQQPPAPAPTEREPNNTIATANPVTLGDTVIGVTNPNDDVDHFGFDLTAGDKVEIVVVAQHTCLQYTLIPPDSTQSIFAGCMANYRYERDSLYYLAPVSGRYTLEIGSYEGSGGPDAWYAVKIGRYQAPPRGPGDPTTIVASGFTTMHDSWVRVEGTAADASGGLYAATNGVLSHVSATGTVQPVATGIYTGFGAMAMDAFGDLLVVAYTLGAGGSAQGVVWRFTPGDSTPTPFVVAPDQPSLMFTGIAIGPDGDVWLADPGMQNDSKIWRFDPVGNLKTKIDVHATGRAWNLAMSPRGELHYVTQDGDVYRLVGTTPQKVAHGAINLWANPIAFDRDGYFYFSEVPRGKVLLFDPQYQVVSDPFSQVLDSLGWSEARVGAGPVFLRDQSGNMTRRVTVVRYCCEGGETNGPSDTLSSPVVELNVSAIRAPGADVAPRLQRGAVSADAIANALMGGAALPDSAVQSLDQHGNRNGILDAGDLRAYLRSQNVVTAPRRAFSAGIITRQESDRLRARVMAGR